MPAQSYFPLPVTVDGVTTDWLTAAFGQRASGVTVLASEIVDVLHTTTTKIRMRLTLNEAGKKAGIPELVIVKGGFQEHSRELDHMHRREVQGYRDVFPNVPIPHPACFFADFDADRRQGIIIMEDLAARGVTFCHALKPQSFEQVSRRLVALARFHAVTWDSADLRHGGKWSELPEFFAVMQGFFDKCTSPEHWDRFMAMPRGVATSFRLRDRDWMVEAWSKMHRYALTLPHCVLHGDVHLGNLYIEPDGTPGFFDTLASHGPGMLEVSYHISASIDIADRLRWEGALVQVYLDELQRGGVTPPPFDEAMRQYAIFLIYGLFIWQTTESHFQPETVNTANTARMSAAMLEHEVASLIQTLDWK